MKILPKPRLEALTSPLTLRPLSFPKRLVLFDLDGVVYRGETPTVGAAESLERVRNLGCAVWFLTNNSSRTRASYVEKLEALGIPAPESSIMTSAYATARYLVQEGFTGHSAMVVGEEGIFHELAAVGIRPVPSSEEHRGEPVDLVVVGIDRFFTYERLLHAQQALLHGARFIATNLDPTFPTETVEVPGGGSIVAAIATASGQQPFVVGKPNTFALELVLSESGCAREEAVLVGDRLDTDIDVGRGAGMDTVLTLTGVTTLEQALEARTPNVIIPDLRSIEGVLRGSPDSHGAGTRTS